DVHSLNSGGGGDGNFAAIDISQRRKEVTRRHSEISSRIDPNILFLFLRSTQNLHPEAPPLPPTTRPPICQTNFNNDVPAPAHLLLLPLHNLVRFSLRH